MNKFALFKGNSKSLLSMSVLLQEKNKKSDNLMFAVNRYDCFFFHFLS